MLIKESTPDQKEDEFVTCKPEKLYLSTNISFYFPLTVVSLNRNQTAKLSLLVSILFQLKNM